MFVTASAIFWVLLWFGRDDLDPRWRMGLMVAWVILFISASFVPGGSYIFMAIISIIDIGLVLKVFGGDIVIR